VVRLKVDCCKRGGTRVCLLTFSLLLNISGPLPLPFPHPRVHVEHPTNHPTIHPSTLRWTASGLTQRAVSVLERGHVATVPVEQRAAL
jgi:hypothetical protein